MAELDAIDDVAELNAADAEDRTAEPAVESEDSLAEASDAADEAADDSDEAAEGPAVDCAAFHELITAAADPAADMKSLRALPESWAHAMLVRASNATPNLDNVIMLSVVV